MRIPSSPLPNPRDLPVKSEQVQGVWMRPWALSRNPSLISYLQKKWCWAGWALGKEEALLIKMCRLLGVLSVLLEVIKRNPKNPILGIYSCLSVKVNIGRHVLIRDQIECSMCSIWSKYLRKGPFQRPKQTGAETSRWGKMKYERIGDDNASIL